MRNSDSFLSGLTMTRRDLLGAFRRGCDGKRRRLPTISPASRRCRANSCSSARAASRPAANFSSSAPGKLRFNYDDPSPMRVIADGKNVAIGNTKLKTWDLYPLSKTPLSLLLAQRIDLSAGMVKGVKEESDLTTIALGNNTVFGNSTITMMFDPKTYDLRQWTITDNQGKDTSVMIFNVKTGVQFDDRVFRVPYESIPGTPQSRD